VNIATLGLALLITPTLTYRSAIIAYAQADLTAEEEAKIQAFLATEPQDNDTTNLGEVKVDQPTTGYTFPGVNNYTSLFKTRAKKITLDQDYEFMIDGGDHAGKTVKVKDWTNVKGYLVNSMSDSDLYLGNGMGNYMFVDEVTLIDQADGSEFTVKNAVLSIGDEEGYRYFDSLWPNRYTFDMPIEAGDPRFQPEIEDASLIPLFGNGYWTLHATVTEMVPYETIVKVDESLKTGEVEEDVAGVLGDKTGKYDITYSPSEDLQGDTYKQYTSDVIYADLLANVTTEPVVNDMLSKPWGDATVTDFTSSPATNRVLRVGIDYTHFVTEDGTSVVAADGTPVAKKYGLQPQETFAGYEYVTTRVEANGDRVHVYKPVVAIPATLTAIPTQPAVPTAITGVVSTPVQTTPVAPTAPSQVTETSAIQSTPKTGDTGLFTSTFMLFTGMIGSIGAFITKKKNS
ncbi:MAG: hypothetical protein HXL40_06295, partial [Solobacterium sp.]|nr:hypothetical protein [Solobacterium sp.]